LQNGFACLVYRHIGQIEYRGCHGEFGGQLSLFTEINQRKDLGAFRQVTIGVNQIKQIIKLLGEFLNVR
jgi:hypothetical protein